VHPNDGASTNPYPHLNRAYRLLFAAPGKADTALWLKGSVLTQQPEALKVNVNSLGVRTTGLKLNGISRPVQLALSPFTVIQNVAGRLAGTGRATVWTEIFPNTLAAQLGKPTRSPPSASLLALAATQAARERPEPRCARQTRQASLRPRSRRARQRSVTPARLSACSPLSAG
jgi:hypothetical protein